ncbi:cytochrome c oxidase accessory protein CcoG [Oceanisphaera arctica]|uniref:Cytochrome c oxidase accessory protein CcoG n=1 Tax=Oceanisphaera arctica TaxID=641510 RepID=A0A2P5THZ4_9GAMM|nr:cytochrome c oxidase accessory protein CcoG [Oceanisphaera arctica]PPL14188.1 cytochrome c oxidase accessory protein CcoG [Oceanisphaera arctica]GHA19203.1 cytochrome c oxidase accessory protein CcoG [Oceanisphaera arctica]
MENLSSRIDVKVCTDPRPIDQGHVYVRAQRGRWQRLRQSTGWVLMLLFLVGPWLRWNGQQALLLDLEQQRFHLFGITIWPQDLTLLALFLMVAAFGLFFITAFLGRVWCGYLCPQTVWTFWFIWVEERLEGSANKRRQLNKAPWSLNKVTRKGGKHLIWLLISLLSGFTFIAYFVPAAELGIGLLQWSAGLLPTFWVGFFALCTYLNAGWMRAIMCTHMCPYSRFQSAMFDKDTYSIAYDAGRGERRGPRSRKADARAQGLGDCIDCNLCVQVCPTGIDIRDGLQYECINCGACADACDQTMNQMGYATGLIRYASERQLGGGKTRLWRPKLTAYGLMMVLMLGVLVYAAANRVPMALDVQRDRNQLFRETPEGLVENTYTLKLSNRTQQPQLYRVRVEGMEALSWVGAVEVIVPAGEIVNLPISLAVDPYLLRGRMHPLRFVADNNETAVGAESQFFSPGW